MPLGILCLGGKKRRADEYQAEHKQRCVASVQFSLRTGAMPPAVGREYEYSTPRRLAAV